MPAILAALAIVMLALLPSCIIIDGWNDGGRRVSYEITWHNNSRFDVDVWIGGEKVVWADGATWLYSWETLSSDTSFEEGDYSVGVYNHWNGSLVSSGTIYIGPGSQEFVTYR